MPTFAYTARSLTGLLQKGVVTTLGQAQALEQLKKQHLTVLALQEKRRRLRSPIQLKRVTLFEKMNFTKQFAVMIQSGLPIVESLEILDDQTGNAYFKSVLTSIKESVRSGTGLSKALERHKAVFGSVYVAMIAAGEKSGELDKVLLRLGQSLESEFELLAKIKGAFYYPIFILIVLIAMVIFVLTFVIPQLKTIFAETGATLPFLTRVLIGLSDFVIGYFWLIPVLVVATAVALHYLVKLQTVKRIIDQVKLRLPVFGTFYQKIYLERFCRTLASLLAAGLPILDVITTTSLVVTNLVYQQELASIKSMVERGQPLSEALRQQRHFPAVVANLLAIGEKTGKLSNVAEDLANFYGKEIDQTAKNLTSLLEPFIMLVMGVGIGLVVAAVVMPIYQLIGIEGS